MSWRGFFLRAGILTNTKDIAIQRGNLTVQKEIIAKGIVPDQLVTNGVETYTIAQLLTGFIRRDPTGSARADLLPTAALIVAGIENVFVGATFNFAISNEGSVTEIITVTTAAGLTLTGTMTIDGGDLRLFRAEVTGVTTPAVEIRSLGLGIEGLLATTAELQFLDGATAGTQVASKAVIADANVNIGVVKATELHIGATSSEVKVEALPLEINEVCDMSSHVVAPATGGLTMTAALHGNRILYYDDADGDIVLPAATGTGYKYTIVLKTAATAMTIKAASASDSFLGGVSGVDGDADTAIAYSADPADDTITLNGVATGGIVGDMYCFTDIATGLFLVEGYVHHSGGSEATPFSATVN